MNLPIPVLVIACDNRMHRDLFNQVFSPTLETSTWEVFWNVYLAILSYHPKIRNDMEKLSYKMNGLMLVKNAHIFHVNEY